MKILYRLIFTLLGSAGLVTTLVAAPAGSARVDVLAVLVVPADANPGDEKITSLTSQLQKHVAVSQLRYQELLQGRDTFVIAPAGPLVYRSSHALDYFVRSSDQGAAKITSELLALLNLTPMSCNHVLLAVFVNQVDLFPLGGGRELGGGLNSGCGIVVVSSREMELPGQRFQSTLQHELGHAFGLVHTNAYGYSMETGDSIMSYNHVHDWKGFTPPAKPAVLLPEDLRALAQNKRVFPDLYFDPARDIPAGYTIAPTIKKLAAMDLDIGHSDSAYVVYQNGVAIRTVTRISPAEAIGDLAERIHGATATVNGQRVTITGKWNGAWITLDGTGYELYWNGQRVGHEEGWSKAQALANLRRWNNEPYLKQAVGLYNGEVLIPQ